MNILDELYEGNLRPGEERFKNKNYTEASIQRQQYQKLIENELSDVKLAVIENMNGCIADMEFEFGKEMFKTGFSLALKISAESFIKE